MRKLKFLYFEHSEHSDTRVACGFFYPDNLKNTIALSLDCKIAEV